MSKKCQEYVTSCGGSDSSLSLFDIATSRSCVTSSKTSTRSLLDEDRLALTYCATQVQPVTESMIPHLLYEKYYHGVQQDASEFLQRVLDSGTESPSLALSFRGTYEQTLHCAQACHGARAAPLQTFQNVILQLKKPNATVVRNVQEALDEYMPPEYVDDNFKWTCPVCGDTEAPAKIHHIKSTPDVLFVLLCRWDAADDAGAILDAIDVSTQVLFGGAEYQLSSNVMHQGDSPRNGHYVSVLRHVTSNEEWWYYDDAIARRILPEELRSKPNDKSYVLFYEKIRS